MRHQNSIFAALLFVCFGGCQGPSACPDGFCIGGPGDPVVALSQSLNSSTRPVYVGVYNNMQNEPLSEGLLTFQPLFTVGQNVSSQLFNFVSNHGAYPGDATALASALGLSLGVNAFTIPAVNPRSRTYTTITVPPGATQMYYVAFETLKDGAFAASNGIPTSTLAATQMTGYQTNNYPSPVVVGSGDGGGALNGSYVGLYNPSRYANGTLQCPAAGTMPSSVQLISDDFHTASPMRLINDGYDAVFNGDWWTDGTTARVVNPSWPGAGANTPPPTVTGFVKFFDVCPNPGATLELSALVDTHLATDPVTDTTLVVYFFDQNQSIISTAANDALRAGNQRQTALHGVSIPAGTVRIGIVPMVRLGPTEKMSVYYYNLHAMYVKPNAFTSTTVMSDDFASYGPSPYGNNFPTGWAAYNGSWYVYGSSHWVTPWNTAWGNKQTPLPPLTTSIYKTFPLGAYAAGDTLSAQAFAAATFTDPTSWVHMVLTFDTGAQLVADPIRMGAWGNLDLYHQPIPAGATTVKVALETYLGAAERSSMYIQNVAIQTVRGSY